MGHHNHHFSGDPYATTGAWGLPTSAANFCEEDYAVTSYVAEFMNTLTNLAYIYFATLGNSQPGRWRRRDFLDGCLLVVGFCSASFHMTLRHTCQFADELSMNLLGAVMLQALWTKNQSAAAAAVISTVLYTATAAASIAYVWTGNVLHHVYTFTLMVCLIGLRVLYLILAQKRPAGERARLLKRFWKGAVVLGVGYALWHLDLEKCAELRQARQAVGNPLGFLLEMHGWWHVLTAAGAAQFIELIRRLTED